ncbi:MAG: hypothetical protein KBG02_04875 [Haliscomenobacter sp.]|nr:hypothetical protein [Haliscomenobacter sp.]MBK8655839.1 hypothetical protein [Haliscomenobacter sp.]MBP9076171.1 hypothetical protein [Haliscomenobacter sp.]MBP9873517.1 hypothetical protein [Haliscomenobacter sp.]
MIINDQKTLREIQRAFNQLFNALKIEFFTGHHEAGQGSPMATRLDGEQPIGRVRTTHTEGDFRVHENMTVREFEQAFYDTYGLNVQVFRRSGNIWIQTTATDSWTLAEQNRKGSSSERLFNEKYNPL